METLGYLEHKNAKESLETLTHMSNARPTGRILSSPVMTGGPLLEPEQYVFQPFKTVPRCNQLW